MSRVMDACKCPYCGGPVERIQRFPSTACSASFLSRPPLPCFNPACRWESLLRCRRGNCDVQLGRLAGLAGVLVSAVTVVVRLSGAYWLAGFQVGTLLLAEMLMGCLSLLMLLTSRAGARD